MSPEARTLGCMVEKGQTASVASPHPNFAGLKTNESTDNLEVYILQSFLGENHIAMGLVNCKRKIFHPKQSEKRGSEARHSKNWV